MNREFRADFQWWSTFTAHWNGVAMFPCPTEPAFSDALGSWGCGGFSWFQPEWPRSPCRNLALWRVVRLALARAGIPTSGYFSHSFRIGAATSAAEADSTIQALGRWTSSAFMTYIRAPLGTFFITVSSYIAEYNSIKFRLFIC